MGLSTEIGETRNPASPLTEAGETISVHFLSPSTFLAYPAHMEADPKTVLILVRGASLPYALFVHKDRCNPNPTP